MSKITKEEAEKKAKFHRKRAKFYDEKAKDIRQDEVKIGFRFK